MFEEVKFTVLKQPSDIFEVLEIGTKINVRSSITEIGVLFLAVTSGKIKVSCNGTEKVLTSGDCLTADLTKGYRFSQLGVEPCKTVYTVVRGDLAYNLIILYGISDFMTVSAPDIADTISEIHKYAEDPDLTERERSIGSSLAFHRILSKILRAASLSIKNNKNTVTLIRNYIDSHLDAKITLDELSRMFFVSKTQIFRIFKEAYGIAPIQYLMQRKIESAKHMLKETNMQISDIAETLSFTDAKHFSKTFRKATGVLPRNYRRSAREEKIRLYGTVSGYDDEIK